jgi:hypothetical protein
VSDFYLDLKNAHVDGFAEFRHLKEAAYKMGFLRVYCD